MQDSIIEKFANLGRDTIPESSSSAREIILDVLKAHPDRWFPKSEFVRELANVEGVAHSKPAIHSALTKLVKAGEIEKNKGGRTNYYRAIQ